MATRAKDWKWLLFSRKYISLPCCPLLSTVKRGRGGIQGGDSKRQMQCSQKGVH